MTTDPIVFQLDALNWKYISKGTSKDATCSNCHQIWL